MKQGEPLLHVSPRPAALDVVDRWQFHAEASGQNALEYFSAQGTDRSHVVFRKLMTPMSLAFAPHQRRTPIILTGGHGLDVGGIDAGSVTAEVVALQSFRDGANQGFISESVGESHSAAAVYTAACPESPIATVPRSQPLPASVIEHLNFRPEAGREPGITKAWDATLREHRKVTPFGVAQPVVYRHAAAFIIQEGTA